MIARKNNKVYRITELEKKSYIKFGYNIYDDDGKLIDGREKTDDSKEIKSLSDKVNKLEAVNENLEEALKAASENKTKLEGEIESLTIANTSLSDKVAELEKKLKKGDK